MLEKIEIKYFTIVINLKNTTAKSYLNFMDDSKIIKKLDKSKIITSYKIKNDFLVIYAVCKPTSLLLVDKVIKSLVVNKMDFIALDELFPNENSYFLNRKDCPNSSSWVKSRFFDKINSIITVEI